LRSAHFYLLLCSAILTMLGVAVSAWGTYLMTIFLHPFDLRGFLNFIADSPEYAMALLEEQRSRASARATSALALKNLETIAKLAGVNPERPDISLVGVGLLFLGFALQAVGVMFSLIDLAWVLFSGAPLA
jgi:hypothetical protein